MLKRLILLARKPTLTREAMLHYWRHTHAPLAMRYPEWFESTHRYTQNHLGEQMWGAPFAFDGMVESWQRPAGAVGRSFPDTAAYREVVGPDELNFVDRDHSLLFFVEEHVLQVRVAPIKLLVFVIRNPETSPEDFAQQWLADGRQIDRSRGGWPEISGHVRNIALSGSHKIIGVSRDNAPLVIDGVEELRFANVDSVRRVLASAAWHADCSRGGCIPLAAVLSREVTLFDRDAQAQA